MKQEIEELFIEGQFKFMDEDFQGAIVIFSRVIEMDPDAVKAYQARAIANLRLDNRQEALEDIDMAIQKEPSNPRLHYHKGAILMQFDQLDEAIEALSHAITLAPDYAPAYLLRSQVFEKLGEEEAAAADFSQSLNLRKEETKSSKVVDF